VRSATKCVHSGVVGAARVAANRVDARGVVRPGCGVAPHHQPMQEFEKTTLLSVIEREHQMSDGKKKKSRLENILLVQRGLVIQVQVPISAATPDAPSMETNNYERS